MEDWDTEFNQRYVNEDDFEDLEVPDDWGAESPRAITAATRQQQQQVQRQPVSDEWSSNSKPSAVSSAPASGSEAVSTAPAAKRPTNITSTAASKLPTAQNVVSSFLFPALQKYTLSSKKCPTMIINKIYFNKLFLIKCIKTSRQCSYKYVFSLPV